MGAGAEPAMAPAAPCRRASRRRVRAFFAHAVTALALMLALLLPVAAPAQRLPRGSPPPSATLFDAGTAFVPIDRLPADLRALLRDPAGRFDWFHPLSAPDDPRRIRVRAVRLLAPFAERRFVMLVFSDRGRCSERGCPARLYEALDRAWALRLRFQALSAILLDYATDRYPVLLGRESADELVLHWWEDGRYLAICLPPALPACAASNAWREPSIVYPSPFGGDATDE